MSDKTAISSTDCTSNPRRGYVKLSPGCAHCYMFRRQTEWG